MLPYLVVPLISARVPLISTRVSAHCQAILLAKPGVQSSNTSQVLLSHTEYILQTCQPLRILHNHYAFRVSNTPLRKPVQNVGKLRILWNFGAIRPIPRNLQQLSRLAVSRKSPAGQNIDKDLFILRLPSASASDFAIRSTKEASCRGETMPNET